MTCLRRTLHACNRRHGLPPRFVPTSESESSLPPDEAANLCRFRSFIQESAGMADFQ
jgi:hypothetical protein